MARAPESTPTPEAAGGVTLAVVSERNRICCHVVTAVEFERPYSRLTSPSGLKGHADDGRGLPLKNRDAG